MLYKQTAAVFIVLMFLLPIFAFGFVDSDFSEMENRVLQTMPQLALNSVIEGRYMQEMTSYVQDQFWQRPNWVNLKNSIDLALGRRDIGGTYIGPGGSYIEKRPQIDPDRFKRNLQTVTEFSEWSSSLGIENYFLGVPSTHTIYPERLPKYAVVSDEAALRDSFLDTEANFTYVDAIPPGFTGDIESIDRVFGQYYTYYLAGYLDLNLYFHTDHHWTAYGAYVGYASLMEAMGIERKELEDISYRTDLPNFRGSLHSRAPHFNAVADVFTIFDDKTVRIQIRYREDDMPQPTLIVWNHMFRKDKYPAFLGGVQPQIRIHTDTDNGRRLLILKDSFAHPLAEYLVTHFEAIYLLDLRYFNASVQEYVLNHDITDILFCYNLSWFAADSRIDALLLD